MDEMSWDDLSQGRNDWPSVRAAHAYRKQVRRPGALRGASK